MRQALSYGLDLLLAFFLASDRKTNSKSHGGKWRWGGEGMGHEN